MAKVNMELNKDQQEFINSLPGNSIYKKNEEAKDEPHERRTDKVISGAVVKRKSSLPSRVAAAFIGEDVADVKGYILRDVIIPSVKNVISEVVGGGIDMLLFGETRARRSKNNTSRSYVSYSSYSSDRRDRPSESRTRELRYSFEPIVVGSYADGEEIINGLMDILEDYGEVRVADLYDMVEITGSFTDNYWGWRNLSSARVKRVRDGYLIDLPRVESLK